jgi:hypothetical protein
LSTLAGWSRMLLTSEIPVQRATAEALDEIREYEESVSATAISAVVLDDPLMTLRVPVHLARNRSSRLLAEVDTVTSAILLIGVPPFLRTFSAMTTVEALLEPLPAALEGLNRVIRRAHRARPLRVGFRNPSEGFGGRDHPRGGAPARLRGDAGLVPGSGTGAGDAGATAGRLHASDRPRFSGRCWASSCAISSSR